MIQDILFLFALGSVIGWFLELFFKGLVKKTWMNSGWLRGSYLPIYGVGLLLLYGIASVFSAIVALVLVTAILICVELVGLSQGSSASAAAGSRRMGAKSRSRAFMDPEICLMLILVLLQDELYRFTLRQCVILTYPI